MSRKYFMATGSVIGTTLAIIFSLVQLRFEDDGKLFSIQECSLHGQVMIDVRTWTRYSDEKLDGRVKPNLKTQLQFEVQDNKISGHYVDHHAAGTDNFSTFTGEFIEGQVPIIFLRQVHEGYNAVLIAREVEDNLYRGTWVDNKGNSGDFEMFEEIE